MRSLIIALTALLVASPSTGSAQSVQQLADRLPVLMQEAGVPGLSAAWIEDGRVTWTANYGIKSAASEEPVTAETVFEAASLSKPVVAYATMKLVARGDLDLDEPLWDEEGYERLAHDERARQITTRMVLTHTTGLPNWGGTPLELNSAPGTAWNYSGEGFVYLATILERKTGLRLDEFVHREVFTPLGMENSSFVWRDDFERLSSTPHDLIGRPRDKNKPEAPNAAASLHTTAADYGRFLTAVMTGEGLPSELASEMLTPHADLDGWGNAEARANLSWGLGWGIQDGERGRAIWHWGDNGNFRCFVIAYPGSGDGLVYFTNSNNGLAIAESAVNIAFPDKHWSLRYLDYGSWDQPRRQARIGLRKAFILKDEGSGWDLLEEVASDLSADIADREARNLGQFLVEEGRTELGVSVLEWTAKRFESAPSFQALAEVQTEEGAYELALAAYEQALSADAGLTQELADRIEWLREGIDGAEMAVRLDGAGLDEYVGRFGPRIISRDGDKLLYSREGASSGVGLIPLTRDLFQLRDNPTFRIRFERTPEGHVIAIIGLYSDGRTDRTERTSR